jgi:hypothetical protein
MAVFVAIGTAGKADLGNFIVVGYKYSCAQSLQKF